MKNKILEKMKAGGMSAEEVALVLSQTIRDVKDRKVTLRYALAISRLALALSKTIEVANLRGKVAGRKDLGLAELIGLSELDINNRK